MKFPKLRFPRLAQNHLSAFGALTSLILFVATLLMLLASSLQKESNPYFGIFNYVVLPTGLLFTLLLIPIGMFRQWRRWKRGETPVKVAWPIVDLNRPGHRNATIVFVVGSVLFLLISAFGTYQAYHFSESVEFCGTTCHTVMHPQHMAYQGSPHARVPCTACHVGEGADWYAKSKLAGAYQLYAVLADNYPRPIPTPIEDLRPAQETCEQCHWPEKTYGAQQRQFNHFRYDEENSLWKVDMLIKTGGGDPLKDHATGIHWHMNIGLEIEYIARDERRQDIPWVKVTDKRTGRVTTYQNTEEPLSEEEIASAERRRMDCLDCHNRPSHVFYSPDYAIDRAMAAGRIDRRLPHAKRIAVEVMAAEYEDSSEALRSIANTVTEFYRGLGEDFYRENRAPIDRAILAIQDAFSHNIFPEMKVRWSEYPNNIGHYTDIGCMRCHAGSHESDAGLKISHDCRACHTIMSQGPEGELEMATSPDGLDFKHPEDIDEAWQEMGCHECHEGTQP